MATKGHKIGAAGGILIALLCQFLFVESVDMYHSLREKQRMAETRHHVVEGMLRRGRESMIVWSSYDEQLYHRQGCRALPADNDSCRLGYLAPDYKACQKCRPLKDTAAKSPGRN